MELYSAVLTMDGNKPGDKAEYQLYFASERDAEDYLETYTEEGTYTVEREYVNDKDFFYDYNQTIETNIRNQFALKYEREKRKALQEAQEVGVDESNVKTVEVVREVEVIREVEPKLWWVEVGNDAPVIFRSWSEVQEMLSRIEEETYELDINIKPISVRELVLQFNALSEE